MLSRQAKAGRLDELKASMAQALEISLLLALPAAVALIVSAHPIMDALFAHGKFTDTDAANAAIGLSAYSIGIPAYVLAKILSVGFFARHDTKTPVKYSTIAIVANTLMSLSLIHWLGYVGIALATGVTAWLNVGLLVRRMRGDRLLEFTPRLRFALPRLLLAAAAMAAALYGIGHALDAWWTGTTLLRAAGLSLLVGSGAIVYLGMAAVMGVLTRAEIRTLSRRRNSATS